MTNIEICKLFRNVAASYTIKDEKKYRFQIIAYQKAADSIENFPTELIELFKEEKLEDLPGIGPSIKAHLQELFKTGEVQHFKAVYRGIPAAFFPLLDVPGFGPKKAFRLVSEFRLHNPETVLQEITKLAQDGKIATLEGFGETSQSDILRRIQEYWKGKTKTSRMVLPYATELARKIISYLTQCEVVEKVYPLGSLRRKVSTVGDIDIAVASNDPKTVINHFVSYPHKDRIIEQGDKTSSILVSSGKQIDLMVQPPEGFGALLQHFTGSKAHNIHLREYALSKGLSLSEYGIKKKGSDTC